MQPIAEWVVRGGECKSQDLINGYIQHRGVPTLFGLSVQYWPGATIDQLAQAGNFPNAQISYATVSALQAAVAVLGFQLQLMPSPGTGYHHTLTMIYNNTGVMVQTLATIPHVASDLSQIFQHRANAYRRQPTP